MLKYILFISLAFTFSVSYSQTDLLDALGDEEEEEEIIYAKSAFKSSRVINSHSMEMIAHGALDFRILHRFGELSGGAYELFGLDQASMRMGFDYGMTKNFTIGIGRSTFKKELDGFVKYRILHQSSGKKVMPVSIIYVGGITCDGMKFEDTTRVNYFSSRLAYYNQLIIGRKFSDGFTLQLSPTVVHRNLIESENIPNDLYALGVGGRIKLTKRMAITADYFYVLNRTDSISRDPLSVGIDIETGGHVFQLHFSNTSGMNERAFITDTEGDWGKLEIRFGFNLSRMFQVYRPESD